MPVTRTEPEQVHEKPVDLVPYRPWTFRMSDETLEVSNKPLRLPFIRGVEDLPDHLNNLESPVPRSPPMTTADVLQIFEEMEVAPLVHPSSIIAQRDESMRAVSHNCSYVSHFFGGEGLLECFFPVLARLIASHKHQASEASDLASHRARKDDLADELLTLKLKVNAVSNEDEQTVLFGERFCWKVIAFPCQKAAVEAAAKTNVWIRLQFCNTAKRCVKPENLFGKIAPLAFSPSTTLCATDAKGAVA